ncbi:hypothetical protein E2L06_20265 [Haloterrigena sp. H1]|uniref:hypothetical protein n=1 Tax=Haloterrigena sp. H1 TaxID=2552943 RepID=UPI00110D63D1|nr:hypothetical protein [Haloterrigena sp. H1]TMT79049.1 hypothetical protein E2L06_19670 [Haloterrigena sp. H1]TMT79149.1 hypothetical protein E2L06_20265 [Haloterrigena sp. H1]
MYNGDWEPVMTADSMEKKIKEFANLAHDRANQENKDIEEVVHDLTHNAYLMKHTSGDVLSELQELESTYPDAFYNGDANDHIMTYLDGNQNFDFWYDYAYLSLAAGLEWAVLDTLEETATSDDSP